MRGKKRGGKSLVVRTLLRLLCAVLPKIVRLVFSWPQRYKPRGGGGPQGASTFKLTPARLLRLLFPHLDNFFFLSFFYFQLDITEQIKQILTNKEFHSGFKQKFHNLIFIFFFIKKNVEIPSSGFSFYSMYIGIKSQ